MYAGMSLFAFIAYAIDKSAAVNGRSRISERTLHLMSLIGGWPGALVAQRLIRHKTQKQPFRRFLWTTVVFNCGGLSWLLAAKDAADIRGFIASLIS
ncbi:MAG: DUF1294 domain-containing protein [Kordiimonadaceae bacterium]|nr:DUF1294 domain-containing protein [Kordiimonadaceae bacterium]